MYSIEKIFKETLNKALKKSEFLYQKNVSDTSTNHTHKIRQELNYTHKTKTIIREGLFTKVYLTGYPICFDNMV